MEPKDIHVGFGSAHNGGVEVWDWNAPIHEDGSPKFIAHINDGREVTFLEDNLPIDAVDQIKAIAKADWNELFAIETVGRDYNPPTMISFGEHTSTHRAEDAEGTHPSDAPNYDEPTYPLSVYIENAYDPNLHGFSIPLPATEEKIQSFIAEIKITDWRDIKIVEVESDIKGLGEKLTGIISDNGNTPDTLDELNYLAARLEGLGEIGIQIFSANIEVGRHSSSIAEMINLTINENVNQFDVWPAYDAADYGDILVNQFMPDEHAIAFNRLKDSENPEDRAIAAYIEKLEEHADEDAFGRATAKEEGGVFTKEGYLVGGKDELEQLYQGVQDIPAEYCLLSQSAKAPRHIIKIDDANITEAIIKLHAVGCRNMEHAANNVKIFLDDHKRLTENDNNYISNHYVLVLNRSDISLAPAMELCKRGSDFSKFVMSMAGLAATDANRTDTKIFAVRVNNAHEADAEKGGRNLRGDFIELTPHALSNHITRYAAVPDRVDILHDDGTKMSYDLFEWGQMLQQQGGNSSGIYSFHYSDIDIKEAAANFGSFIGNHEMMSLAKSFEAYLPSINVISKDASMAADMEQPLTIRIANEAAKEILARGDADVYRLTDNGLVKLHAIEAARLMCVEEYKDLAIRQKDSVGLEKWAERKVGIIVRQTERAEHQTEKNKREVTK